MGRVLKNTCEICKRPRRKSFIGTMSNRSNTRHMTYCVDNTMCAQVARSRVEGTGEIRTKTPEIEEDDDE